MSTVIERLNLTLYGCPLHYIKAREALGLIKFNQNIVLTINNGAALEEILNSLRQDGHRCKIEQRERLTTNMRVTKKT